MRADLSSKVQTTSADPALYAESRVPRLLQPRWSTIITKRIPPSKPTWAAVKAQLAGFDRAGLIGLIQDLYAAEKDNRNFLHSRFGLGEDVLKPYIKTLNRWLWPDVLRNQDISVAKAKKAISDYRKAVGEPAGLAELMVVFCENAVAFSNEVGYQDGDYINTVIRMFEEALKLTRQLSSDDSDALVARLRGVRSNSKNLGYNLPAELDSVLEDYIRA
jgi:hypothetical protein